MTKAVLITNVSNWENEDVEVSFSNGGDGLMERKVHLKPGASIKVLEIDYENVKIIDANPDDKSTKPFRDGEGKQVFPVVKVEFK